MFKKVLISLYFCLPIKLIYGQTEVFFTQITHSTRYKNFKGNAPAGYKLYKNNYSNSFAAGVAVPIIHNFSLYAGCNYIFTRNATHINIDYVVGRKMYSSSHSITIIEAVVPMLGIRYKFKDKFNFNLSGIYQYQNPIQMRSITGFTLQNANGSRDTLTLMSSKTSLNPSKWGFVCAAEYKIAKVGRFNFYAGLTYLYLKPSELRTVEIAVQNQNYKHSYSPSRSFLGLTVSAAYIFKKQISADKI